VLKNPLPRVAAIHDICAYGRCSLTVAIPILSAMGFEVAPVPTAVLSTHTLFPDFVLIDMTAELPRIIDHWKKLNLKFEAIYSGFLGSPRQVDIVADIIGHFASKDTLVVVDPVMADNGRLYPTMPPEMVDEMKKLARLAKVITPNLTEAAFLLNRPTPESISGQEVRQWLKKLTDLGPEMAVITSAPLEGRPNAATVVAYDRLDGRYWRTERPHVPAQYHGTGDIFASVLTGRLLSGDSLPVAMDRSAQFVATAIRATFGYRQSELEHNEVLLEKALGTLNLPVKNTFYELMD
jgi:pyridoxine kinase